MTLNIDEAVLAPSTPNDNDGYRPPSFDSAAKARLRRTRLRSANSKEQQQPMRGIETSMDNNIHNSIDSTDKIRADLEKNRREVITDSSVNGSFLLSSPVRNTKESIGSDENTTDFDLLNNNQNTTTTLETPSKRSGRRSQFSANRNSESPNSNIITTSPQQPQAIVPLTLKLPQSQSAHVEVDKNNSIAKVDSSFDYLLTEQIEPCKNPTQVLNRVLRGLEAEDWPEIFHTLNSVRKLALHHQSVLLNANGALHTIVLQVMKRVDALRSSLAKNAIMTISDMLKGLGKNMDTEIANIVPGLLKVMRVLFICFYAKLK
jgi:hypothetical protein